MAKTPLLLNRWDMPHPRLEGLYALLPTSNGSNVMRDSIIHAEMPALDFSIALPTQLSFTPVAQTDDNKHSALTLPRANRIHGLKAPTTLASEEAQPPSPRFFGAPAISPIAFSFLREVTGSGLERTRGLCPSNPEHTVSSASSASYPPFSFFAPLPNKLSPDEQDEVRGTPAEIMASLKNDIAHRQAQELTYHEGENAQNVLQGQKASVVPSMSRTTDDSTTRRTRLQNTNQPGNSGGTHRRETGPLSRP